jgi:hypothetical protein
MKYPILVIVIVGILILATACGRKSAPTVVQQPGEVVFARAGISLLVGEGWRRIDLDPGVPVCPPTLVSGAGMVRAMIFDANRPDPQTAAARLQASFEENADADKTSFRQEDFKTESGLAGVHLSHTARQQKGGTVTEIRSHNYIVKNQEGRCVAISYTASAQGETDSVCQMVCKTLKLQ